MARETSLSKHFLNAIHRQRTSNRDLSYWLGFLEGVASSGTVEQAELQPLLAHSEKFLKEFDDDDARDLVEDLKLAWEDSSAEAHEMLLDIIDVRLSEISMSAGRNLQNRFLGFLKGTACDGHIFKREVEATLKFLDAYPQLLEDSRIADVRRVSAQSLEDGVITDDESEELCLWISRLVGDSFADTGLSSPTDTAASELFLSAVSVEDVRGSTVVMTGEFTQVGLTRPQIQIYLERMGANCVKSVSKKVDFLFVAQEASRYWATPNAGTKLIKAHQLLAKGDKPQLVAELALVHLLNR